MTVVVSSDEMDWAETTVTLAVAGRVGKYRNRRMQFAVHKLARLREVRKMLDLMLEHHSDRKIEVVNIEPLQQAFDLDCFLEDVKHTLVDNFHPVPGGDREKMKKDLGFGEVEPLWEKMEMEMEVPSPIKRRNPRREEHAKECLRREDQAKEHLKLGELERHGIDNLKPLADSLLDNDVKGVVAEEAIRQIHSSATTVLNSLRHLQRVAIPKTLREIQMTRNKEVILER